MRRAFSLPELLLVIAVVGILFGIALPSLTRAVDRVEVHAAAAHLVAAHQRARMMAVAKGQVLTLTMDSAALTISQPSSSTVLWSEPGPAASGVLLPGPTRHLTFAPEGFTLGLSNASLHLVRGSASRTVVFSRLGRARLLP
jgi:prepilin-type N-terminal cleavage/methylation domain-containing protein